MCLIYGLENESCSHRTCLLHAAFPSNVPDVAKHWNAKDFEFVHVFSVPGAGIVVPKNPYDNSKSSFSRNFNRFASKYLIQTAGPWPVENGGLVAKENVTVRYISIEISQDTDGYYDDVRPYAFYIEEGGEICL